MSQTAIFRQTAKKPGTARVWNQRLFHTSRIPSWATIPDTPGAAPNLVQGSCLGGGIRTMLRAADSQLISNEEGMRFQGLAVILSKQHWPDFVASERKKDLGADAIGNGKALACSLTATLEKLKSDATRIKHKCCDAHTIVFATPQRVSSTTIEKWKEEIRKEFKYHLVVMSREDVVTSLMIPSKRCAVPRSPWFTSGH